MRSWKTIAITLAVLVIIIRWSRTWEEKGSRHTPPAPEVETSAPITPPPVEDSLAPPDEPPSAEELPPSVSPEPRSAESRAAIRRDFENPLVPSDSQAPPAPRRASDSGADVEADFDQIYLMFRDFRTLTGGNPVGTNSEIMKAIMGDNPKGARLGPPDGLKLNEHGELIDRWGTPYFFHQLTSDIMEIHSAGPDRRLWSEDDIVGD